MNNAHTELAATTELNHACLHGWVAQAPGLQMQPTACANGVAAPSTSVVLNDPIHCLGPDAPDAPEAPEAPEGPDPTDPPAPPEEAPPLQEYPPASEPEQAPAPEEWSPPPNEQEPSQAPIEMPFEVSAAGMNANGARSSAYRLGY